MAEPEPPQKGRRWSWSAFAGGMTALVTAIAGLVAALGAAGVIGGGDDSSEPDAAVVAATTTAPETTGGAKTLVTFTPTPAEQRLLRAIPADLQPSCERTAEADQIFPAEVSLFCYDQALEEPGYVRFVQFDSAARLDDYMEGRVTLGNQQRRCGTGPSGSGPYSDSEGQPVGTLVCYLDRNGAWIEWTNDAELVYGVANKPDADWSALYDFWARVGPTAS
jgi:hypothetical protein